MGAVLTAKRAARTWPSRTKNSAVGRGRSGKTQTFSRLLAFFRGQDRSHTGQAEPLAAVRLNAELLVGAVLTAKKAARKSAVEDKTSAFGGPTTPAPALYFINNFHGLRVHTLWA